MIRNLLSLFFLFFFLSASYSQNYLVTGTLIDQLNKLPLSRASISAIRVKDSVLISYSRSDKNGAFTLQGLDTGTYSIQFFYPGFLGNLEEISLSQTSQHQQSLDTITMLRQDQFLNEVTILDNRAIMIKGDTIQFAADSFKVGEGANVEDLLKKLPGLQVDRKGAITAMGEKVEKVYVDGEEFFGSDPTIATKNIQAKAIKNVQVFDKKSEQAELTGIDDGNKIKALNLQLKDAYKKGYFGKLIAGNGFNPYYFNYSAMGQFYTGPNKISLYGIRSNTGTTGLNWEDRMSFMGGGGMDVMSSGSDLMIAYSSDDEGSWDGQYNGRGYPNSTALGGAYSTKLFKNKLKLNLGYGYTDNKLEVNTHTFRKQFLPNSFLTYDENSEKNSSNKGHSGNMRVEYQLDSSTLITYNTYLNFKNTAGNSIYEQYNNNNEDKLLSEVHRKTITEGENNRWTNSLNIKKEFKKKGRSIYLLGQYNKAISSDSAKINSDNSYYISNIYDKLDQNRIKKFNGDNYNIRLTYNEPLTKELTLTTGAYQSGGKNNSQINTYNKDSEHNIYNQKVDSLSNDYKYVSAITGGIVKLNYKTKKWEINIGTSGEQSGYSLQNFVLDTLTNYTTFKWLPTAGIAYNFSRSHSLRFNYSGSTNAPRADQLQPLKDNTDPLNIVSGNPNLKQEYRQSFNLYYRKSKALSGSYLYASLYGSNTFNSIQRTKLVDVSGRNIYSYINSNGNYFVSMYGGYFYEINKKINLNMGLNCSTSKNTSIINKSQTQVKSYLLSPSIGFNYNIEDKIDYGIDYSPQWNISAGSLVGENIEYYSHEISGYIRIDITKRMKFNTEINIDQQNPQSDFDSKFERYLWNASLSQFLLKNKQLEIKLSVNDLLDNNKGFNRSVNSQEFSETKYNTIRRYTMLSLIYNFKNLDNNKKNANNE